MLFDSVHYPSREPLAVTPNAADLAQQIVRVRRCRHCGRRIVTRETICD